MSAIAYHAISVYEEMAKEATMNEHDELVYEGKFTELFDGLGISRTYYSRIRSLLRKMGYITVVNRGAGRHGSRIILHRRPDLADFTNSTLTEQRNTAILVQELERRVEALEAWRLSQTGGDLNISEALRNHEQRITQVEQERDNAKAERK